MKKKKNFLFKYIKFYSSTSFKKVVLEIKTYLLKKMDCRVIRELQFEYYKDNIGNL